MTGFRTVAITNYTTRPTNQASRKVRYRSSEFMARFYASVRQKSMCAISLQFQLSHPSPVRSVYDVLVEFFGVSASHSETVALLCFVDVLSGFGLSGSHGRDSSAPE